MENIIMFERDDKLLEDFAKYQKKKFNHCWECANSPTPDERYDAIIGQPGGEEFFTLCNDCIEQQAYEDEQDADDEWDDDDVDPYDYD
jgi:hypothetical protein